MTSAESTPSQNETSASTDADGRLREWLDAAPAEVSTLLQGHAEANDEVSRASAALSRALAADSRATQRFRWAEYEQCRERYVLALNRLSECERDLFRLLTALSHHATGGWHLR